MKRLLKGLAVSTLFFAFMVLANPENELNQRLNQLNTLQANFTQRIYTVDGKLIQEGQGELWLKRPNLFRWHMKAPDESVLVSDSKALWFYNPFVEQVTVNSLQKVTADTPFMLIVQNNQQEWQKYEITQQGNRFILTPNNHTQNRNPFEIEVMPNGRITSFIVKEADGQWTQYQLTSSLINKPIAADKFMFTPPAGVTIDDQR